MSRKIYQEPANSFGAKLREYRKHEGMNAEEFAKLINISTSSLSAYELNKSSPPQEVIAALMQETDINIRYLLIGEGGLYNKDRVGEISEEVPQERTTIYKDREVDPPGGEKQNQGVQAGTDVNLDELVNVLAQGDDSAKKALATVIDILAASVKAKNEVKDRDSKNQQLIDRNQNLETEIEQLKIMQLDTSQRFKDLVDTLKKIMEEDSPPAGQDERRNCMIEISQLLMENHIELHNDDSLED